VTDVPNKLSLTPPQEIKKKQEMQNKLAFRMCQQRHHTAIAQFPYFIATMQIL
jgi:hypothetical protein